MLGAASGIATLMLAVPVLAQVSGAQEISDATAPSGTSSIASSVRAPRGQKNIQFLIDKDTAFLANIDSMVTLQKNAVQTRLNALTAAASITDETARQEAVQAAKKTYRTTIQNAREANPDLKSGMQMGFGKKSHNGRGKGHGFGSPKFAEKLGMTEEELKAELDSGKTIEQIAEKKGVELPMRPPFMGGGMRGDASFAR